MIITRAQRVALKRVFDRGPIFDGLGWSMTYRDFRRTVRPYLLSDPVILVPWRGMWIGIEPDGYTHT